MVATHAHDLKQTYAKVADGYEKKNGSRLDIEALEGFVGYLKKGDKILDLGGGTGRDSRWFVDRGFEVVIFDLSEEMLSIARQNVPEAQVVQGDMTQMKFAQNEFSGVWASASLLHLTKEEAKKVMHDIHTFLKKGGIFFCSLKEGDGEKEIEDDKYGQPMKRFFSFYNQLEAEELIESAGFKEVDSLSLEYAGQAWVHAWGRKG